VNNNTVTLDVREDLRKGHEPFTKIMSAATALRQGGNLLIVAPFQPVPLFSVLKTLGFSHTAKRNESGDWEVLFTRQSEESSLKLNQAAKLPDAAVKPPKTIELDARGLEPPQPMVKILEVVTELPEGAELKARTDRRPMHLYAQLEQRGFTGETSEQPDGSFLTYVRRS
jgi:uncharacterized protein (DUF2249 family)